MNEKRIGELKDIIRNFIPTRGQLRTLQGDYDGPQAYKDLLLLLDEKAEKMKVGEYKLRPEVAAFAALMEAELRKHDDRPGWKNEDVQWLFSRLKDESTELIKAIHTKGPISIGREAADVANFAMMIADVSGALKAGEDKAVKLTGGLTTAPVADTSPGLSDGDERQDEILIALQMAQKSLHRAWYEVKRLGDIPIALQQVQAVLDRYDYYGSLILAQPKPTVTAPTRRDIERFVEGSICSTMSHDELADAVETFIKCFFPLSSQPKPTVMEHNMAELITDLTHEESEIVQWKILTEWLRDLGIAVEEER